MTAGPSKAAPPPLPDTLTAPFDKLVYLYLRQRGGASVRELRDALGEPQLRLYPAIDRLADRGLVARRGEAVRLATTDGSGVTPADER